MFNFQDKLPKVKAHVIEYAPFYYVGAVTAAMVGIAIKYDVDFIIDEPKPLFQATLGDKTYKLFES